MENNKILIVEDEEIIRLGLKDNFELENYIVETAGDGDEAIEKADSFIPDLVILDLMIPKKSGFEVCRYIRKKHPDTFIIMLTAKTEETSKVTGLEMGADDYVTKPFSIWNSSPASRHSFVAVRVQAYLRMRLRQKLSSKTLWTSRVSISTSKNTKRARMALRSKCLPANSRFSNISGASEAKSFCVKTCCRKSGAILRKTCRPRARLTITL